MAVREIGRKLHWQVLIQYFSILVLVFELHHGIVITYNMLQMKRNLMISAYFATQKANCRERGSTCRPVQFFERLAQYGLQK